MNEVNNTKIRKLPKSIRTANLVYQILMIVLAGVNMFLLALNQSSTIKIPELYFETFAALITIVPVLWTNGLDKCKEYMDESTPSTTPPSIIRDSTPELDT